MAKLAVFGIVVVIFALLANPCTIGYFFAADKTIDSLPVIMQLVFGEIILFMLGIFLWQKPDWFIARKNKIILFLITMLLFFAFLEIILRIMDNEKKAEVMFFADKGYYVYKPNQQFSTSITDGYTFSSKSNNYGFIDSEFNESDEFVIFLLGDSFAECLQADYNNCAHNQLEKTLSEKCGKKVRVYNFGISNYGTLHELSVLKEYKEKYKPQLVILYFLAQNDLADNEQYLNMKGNTALETSLRQSSLNLLAKFKSKSINFLIEKTDTLLRNILNNVSDKFRVIESMHNKGINRFDVYLNDYDEHWKNLWNIELNALGGIYNETSSDNIPLVIVAVSSPEQVYPEVWSKLKETYPSLQEKKYNLSKPNNMIASFAKKRNIPFLDLVPFFQKNPERLHYYYDGHWNNPGQLFAAEKIEKFILENKLIECS